LITFKLIELVDLFFRFAGVGSLLLISFVWLKNERLMHLWITRCLLMCLSGYLLLTAPIEDALYGHFRGMVLLLTELLPYFLWLYVFVLLKPELRTKDIGWPIKLVALFALVWFIYFFAVQQGRGEFHQVNHFLGIALFCHITFMAMYDLQDDLLQSRRKVRISIAITFGAYSSFLAVLEIFDFAFRGNAVFSVVNSTTIFLLILLFSRFVLNTKMSSQQQTLSLPDNESKETDNPAVPKSFQSPLERMQSLMEQQFYTQSDLTIGVLAQELKMPEHRLRLLINKYLGYQNFSTFLNSYRIPSAKNALRDAAQDRIPILTIALSLGYGSIGPFNRIFKQTTGLTPSEYRKKFQNQP
jgi:AraC-like DNA-binding protein